MSPKSLSITDAGVDSGTVSGDAATSSEAMPAGDAAGIDSAQGGDLGQGADVASHDLAASGPDLSADTLMPDSLAPDMAAPPDMGPPPECTVSQTRMCYGGPTEKAGVGVCKYGTQSCDSTGHWSVTCSGFGTPGLEVCNGMDDDCNGKTDDIPRTEQVYPVTTAALQMKDSRCDTTTDAAWAACNNAVHLYCQTIGCRTTGIGILESSDGTNVSACVTTEPLRNVSQADLSPFGNCPVSSTPPISAHFECAKAVHGYCKSQGYATGFGPVSSPSPSLWTIACFRSGHATVIDTTYDVLKSYHSGCGGQGVLATNEGFCTTAAKRYCTDKGHTIGYGPVTESVGSATAIVCLDR